MILVLTKPATSEEIKQVSEDLAGYIKVVIDIEKGILTAGGLRHFEAEEILLQAGSRQQDLWGGGIDLETKQIDFDSMINMRPNQNNSSREALDEKVRTKMAQIIKQTLL